MTILVTGARGAIARAVITALTTAGHPLRIATRDPSAVRGEVVGYDAADPGPALRDVSQVFLYADPASAPAFVAAAEAAGVKQVVLLSSLASQADHPGDPHAEAERIIGGGAYATTVLQPGTFMSNVRFWAYQIRATGQVRLPYLDAEEAPIHEQDIADVAIRVFLDGPGNGHDGRAYGLTGPESMTRRHQIQLITEITGTPIDAVDLTPDQARTEMASTMRNPAQLDHLMSYWASRVGSPHPVEPTVELLTAHPARPFTTWLKDNPAAFA
ncbi:MULTISPECIES: NAD(P)H-binding protein [unclassified Kribbella]|uniref:NAD(P)H-binding protein n=1 Tax=unclassified Kribbella TaxID=2644121 RepID=UPI0030196657